MSKDNISKLSNEELVKMADSVPNVPKGQAEL
jgi:hypothetical protein